MERRQNRSRAVGGRILATVTILGILFLIAEVGGQESPPTRRPLRPIPIQMVLVPPLLGSQFSQVERNLGPDLQKGAVTWNAPSDPDRPSSPGTIVRQEPKADKMVPRGTAVNLWVAGPPSRGTPPVPPAGEFIPPPTQLSEVRVPSLVGEASRQAPGLLSPDLKVGREKQVPPDARHAPGTIVRQDPEANQTVPRGTAVNLWVAGKWPEVRVPEVRNLSLPEAEQRLKDRQLVSQAKWGKSSREKGTVLKQDPEAGSTVMAYSQVNLVMADGGWGIIWIIMGAIALGLAAAYPAYKIIESIRQTYFPKFQVTRGEARPGRESLSDVPSLVDFEIRLRGVQDQGTQEIEVEGPLISREEREHE